MSAVLRWFRRRRPEPDPAPRLARAHAHEQLTETQQRWPEIYRLTAAARRAARPT